MGDMNNPNKSLVKAIAIDISEDRSNLALHQLLWGLHLFNRRLLENYSSLSFPNIFYVLYFMFSNLCKCEAHSYCNLFIDAYQ